MKQLLAAANVEVLAQFARSRTLVAFDYDGTLAPIVDDREQATMRPETSRMLAQVSALYPTAVISGRSLPDIRSRLDGISIGAIVGNHGMEPGARMDTHEALVAILAREFAQRLHEVPGVEIEDKRYSLSLHYRRSRAKRAARAAIARAGAQIPGPFRLVSGKQVVNVIPDGAPHKGTALEAIRARVGVDTAIFVGDDTTDEDVFELGQPGRLLSIRIGRKRDSAASYYLENQRGIDELLRALIELRAPRAAQGRER